jgi:hypothetical protein
MALDRLAKWFRRPGDLAEQAGMASRVQFRPANLEEDDICGSGFAITAYTVSDEIGGEAALEQFRERLAQRHIKLMLDFVPNHTAPDHPWVKSNPDYYAQGTEGQIGGMPQNYMRVETDRGRESWRMGATPTIPVGPTVVLCFSHAGQAQTIQHRSRQSTGEGHHYIVQPRSSRVTTRGLPRTGHIPSGAAGQHVAPSVSRPPFTGLSPHDAGGEGASISAATQSGESRA